MAGVSIQKGPLNHGHKFSEVDRDKWAQLIREKRSFIAINIPHDCRCLLDFVREADEVWQELGYKSRDEMLLNGYELQPDELNAAYQWLLKRKPDWAVPYQTAVKLGERGGDRGNQYTGGKCQPYNIRLPKYGTGKAYTLARLQRDRPDLHERVRNGELSANAAAIEAGFRKPPATPLESAKKAIGKMTEVDRRELMAYLKAILG